jgi:ATP-dependent Clp protease ATP-binding subunit ClpB
MTLELTDAARDFLANEGFDPVYGARPLKRAIQHLVIQPLAMRLLQGEFQESDTIVVDVKNGQIVFRREAGKGRQESAASRNGGESSSNGTGEPAGVGAGSGGAPADD